MKHDLLSKELFPLLDVTEDIKTIEKDTYLFHEGDPVNKLYLVKSGTVRISKLSNDGSELTLRHSQAGDLVGELSLSDTQVNSIVNAQMITTGKVGVISRHVLKQHILNDGSLAIKLINLMNSYALRDQTRFRDLVLFGKKGALFSTLIRLTNSYGRVNNDGIIIDFRMTDQELANFCGTSRESINRMLSQLRKDEMISTNKSYITVHDINYLKEAINCGDCPLVICNIH